MAKLHLSPAFDNGKWFPFQGAEIQVRHASPKRVREIRKSVGLPAHPPTGEQLSEEQRVAFNDALLDWTIQAWRGIAGAEGDDDAPCTLENKKALLESHGVLGDWLPARSRLAYLEASAREATDSGNSSGSSTGEQNT